MVLLGDEAQVEARFSPFGDSVSGARFVPNKAWKSFRKHTMELLGHEAQVGSCFGPFGDSVSISARYLHGLFQTRLGNHFDLTR